MPEFDQNTSNHESFERFMVRATAWLLGTLSLIEILTWSILYNIGKLGAPDVWLLPTLAAVFLTFTGLILYRPQFLKLVQRTSLGGLALYELIDLISSGLPEVQSQNAIGVGMVWFPGAIVTAFMVLQHRLAGRLGMVYILIGIGLGFSHFRAGINAAQFNALLQFYASNIGILAVSWVFGHMRSQFLEMRTLAYTDTLTGLLNRRAMIDHLEMAYADHTPFCLLIIDLDEFKRVNDTFGHPVGDQVLREMALTLESHTRKSDLIARWGGEEFLVLTLGSSLIQAQQLADRLLEAVRAANIAGLGLTISIGISERRSDLTLEATISMADVALYQAKNAGRNRTEVAQDS
jgi:diguanylate cyclase (GGDEF)-like protein